VRKFSGSPNCYVTMMSEALRHREKKLGMKSGEGEIINQQKKGDIYRNIVTSLLRSPGIEPVENCFTGNDGFYHHCLLTVSAPRFSISRQYKSIQKQPPISRFSFPFLHHPTPTFPFLVSRCWLLGAFGGFAISGFSFPCADKMDTMSACGLRQFGVSSHSYSSSFLYSHLPPHLSSVLESYFGYFGVFTIYCTFAGYFTLFASEASRSSRSRTMVIRLKRRSYWQISSSLVRKIGVHQSSPPMGKVRIITYPRVDTQPISYLNVVTHGFLRNLRIV